MVAVNSTLIDLYWNIGEYISGKIAREEWGKGTVEALAETIQRRYPGVAGYSAAKPLADAAVLRDVQAPGKTLTAGESFVLEPQLADHEPLQTR